jgi:hypothetical protein
MEMPQPHVAQPHADIAIDTLCDMPPSDPALLDLPEPIPERKRKHHQWADDTTEIPNNGMFLTPDAFHQLAQQHAHKAPPYPLLTGVETHDGTQAQHPTTHGTSVFALRRT